MDDENHKMSKDAANLVLALIQSFDYGKMHIEQAFTLR